MVHRPGSLPCLVYVCKSEITPRGNLQIPLLHRKVGNNVVKFIAKEYYNSLHAALLAVTSLYLGNKYLSRIKTFNPCGAGQRKHFSFSVTAQ